MGSVARCARDVRAGSAAKIGRRDPSSNLERAYEAVLAAEGSDWNWWYGPEHGSANDAEFDELYRKHLTEIYAALGEPAPEVLAHPIKKAPELGRARNAGILSGRDRGRSRDQLFRMAWRGLVRHGSARRHDAWALPRSGRPLLWLRGDAFLFARRSRGGDHCGNSGFSIAADTVGFARNQNYGARRQGQVRGFGWSKAVRACCIQRRW